jgi:dTDP-4-dehydrorhamnose 3,5-epimerase
MRIIPTEIPEVYLLELQIYRDERGFFTETYHKQKFEVCGIAVPHTGYAVDFVQDNYSGSHQGVLRGLHYQLHQAQGKLVLVVVGEIYDVAVDVRKNSPTFGKWVGTRLTANKQQLWVPAGFAHGFYVLSEWAEVYYKATDYYAPEWERTIRWDDPAVGITWPFLDGVKPRLSEKDANAPLLKDAEVYEWLIYAEHAEQ